MSHKKFKQDIWRHYHAHGRDLPWRPPALKRERRRDRLNPYRVLVSELMLQQTQVPRVIPKYREFTKQFPTFRALSKASTKDVLAHWKGLGYNRRAVNLKRAAETVTTKHHGRMPTDYDELIQLPGIGPYTARAVQAFAFNIPVVLIETNVRTVFLYHFFPNSRTYADKTQKHADRKVHDKEILPLVEQTLDHTDPREWYYALMDYGANLKQNGTNLAQASKHYTKQPPFKGSNREARSKILECVMAQSATAAQIARATGYTKKAVTANLETMTKEGLLAKQGRIYSIYT